MSKMPKVYIVEDDDDIREIVLYALQSAEFDGAGFETGAEFFAALENAGNAKKALPSLVLLDIMLPGEDGLAILKRLRAAPRTKTLPVIMLTAKGGEFDKVKALDMGADDYITKPFSFLELISRVNAVLRRSGTETDARVSTGELTLNNDRREVHVCGSVVNLTYKEYELLHYLALNVGLVLSREKIMEAVWGYDFEGESRTLDMHVRALRQKLGAAGATETNIQTVRNVGYRLELGETEKV